MRRVFCFPWWCPWRMLWTLPILAIAMLFSKPCQVGTCTAHCDVAFKSSCRVCALPAVLGGSIFGNVCSPIADNTVLTSMAAQLSITDHVQSMWLYVCLVGGVALLFGTLPVGLGWYPAWAGLLIGSAVLTTVVGRAWRVPSLLIHNNRIRR